ncbi:MAG: D-2-hydroxyacid dehydrogenase [Halorhodospira halophila]|uniref:D-2-hydroxyacid dehydrogenase n=1 Tax=Halorhodospira TaxID=85108 RepID=UPI001913C06E|nr:MULTISPECIES: D-2-hydroxyacid dehydrogenase [Halorhodospira]MBK5936880.1 glycerate dehydrogenase [Halorhodospira halophila]MBK5942325.1 glycerate dehydrogenase [Halorhodospira halophila]MCC3750334.1 D-2-hydroxyacid dehydrogenase [Halorhodospira halophila]MCG5528107.1 D-2-hydroxyacid dehydrogenase [Halorhodospira halophila]MCG5531876.1 D-2-hydroxyacid dehydrogenase [Halorhodospira sp. 9621]
MHTAFLDAGSLDLGDLDLGPLQRVADPLECYPRTRPEALLPRLEPAEAAIVNKVVIDAEALARLPNLRLIAVAATGTNNVDLDAARERGVTVANCRGYGTTAVAQHTLAMILNHFTRIPAATARVRAGEWCSSAHFSLIDSGQREISGRCLGILGYGTLGQRVAAYAEALGMKVRVAERPAAATCRSGRVPFYDLLPEVDVLSLHCPLTETTAGVIDAQALRLMRRDALLVNTARGGLIDEPALAAALRNGEIGAAALDVLTKEPPPPEHPLLAADLPNLAVTPHSAWSALEARQRIVGQLRDILAAFAAGEVPPNQVVGPDNDP